jgi:hypothetical protein
MGGWGDILGGSGAGVGPREAVGEVVVDLGPSIWVMMGGGFLNSNKSSNRRRKLVMARK